MTTSLDCIDRKHDACDASGGCRDCPCHFIGPASAAYVDHGVAQFETLLAWSTPALTPATTRRQYRARHAAQPRGLARLMSDPTWSRNLEVAVALVVGLVVAIAIIDGLTR